MNAIKSAFILDKKIGILIVEPTMSIAGTVRRVLLENGYSNIFIAHSVLDAFNTIGNNAVGWMITAPLKDERLTAWHCLRLPLEVSLYSQIMVSVLTNDEEETSFEDYYALGALSIHTRQLTYNSFQDEIGELFSRLQKNELVADAIAVDVRKRFEANKSWDKLERFEERLTTLLSHNPAQKLHLIEARFKNSSKLEAMIEIKQLVTDHPETLADAKALSQKYLGTADIQTFRGQVAILTALILDPDASQQQFLRTTLTEMGVEIIVCCTTLEAACESLHAGPVFDVVFTEWKLANKVEGHAFIQHVRQHGHEAQPVIIHSSLVKPEDMPLIDDLKGVFIITKPSPKKQFKQALTEVLERWAFPQEGTDIENKIVNALSAGNRSQALSLNKGFQLHKKIERQRKEYIRGMIAFSEGNYQEAKSIILQSAKLGVPSYREISLLGKILLRLGDHASALKFLDQANTMVPGNIERLCNLADVSAEVGKPERALQIATEARKIGGDIGMVQSVFAKHAVANGMVEEVADLLETESTARDMIGYMNNLGIAHAAAQKWAESEVAYRNAMAAMNGRHPHLVALVSYNFGLSMARQNRLPDALALLRDAEIHGEAPIKRKAADLRDRVEKSIAQKVPLVLKEVHREISAIQTPEAMSKLEQFEERAKPDFHGLFRILNSDGRTPGLDLTSELPKSVLRKDENTIV